MILYAEDYFLALVLTLCLKRYIIVTSVKNNSIRSIEEILNLIEGIKGRKRKIRAEQVVLFIDDYYYQINIKIRNILEKRGIKQINHQTLYNNVYSWEFYYGNVHVTIVLFDPKIEDFLACIDKRFYCQHFNGKNFQSVLRKFIDFCKRNEINIKNILNQIMQCNCFKNCLSKLQKPLFQEDFKEIENTKFFKDIKKYIQHEQ